MRVPVIIPTLDEHRRRAGAESKVSGTLRNALMAGARISGDACSGGDGASLSDG